ncbi:unnamed protein product [Auanema sp. JU1783]|nr:unnamed protein product [Auanema sp. JU1783]
MSFASERKSRVAHQPVFNSSVLKSLEQKRQCLAEIAAKVSTGSSKRTPVKASTAKKSKLKIESDEEEEFIDDESEAEEEDEFVSSEEEDRKRKKPPSKPQTVKPQPAKVVQPTLTRKERTLSESSEEEEWLGKPNILGNGKIEKPVNKKINTKVSQPKVPKRKIVLSDESGEDTEAGGSTLKSVAKDALKHKLKSNDESEEEEFLDDEDSDRRETTPSDDSDADERKANRKESRNEMDARAFFNKATEQELLATPRVTEKICQTILSNRPFESYYLLSVCLNEVSRGKSVLDAYEEYLENRGVLEKILYDCRGHAESIEKDYERSTEGRVQPSLLQEGYSLHEYQLIGVNWLYMMHQKGFNCILGDEMGLGKTIQIIAFIAKLKEEKVAGPHLIVVPSSTIENWMGEISRWCPSLKLLTYYGSQDERKQLRHMAKKRKTNIDVVLTTYNMVASKHDDKKFFKNFSINYVIYDEGHMLKNCSTERYRNLMKVRGKRKILLTGTPLQNNLIELISLMYFVLTKVFNKYCEDISQLLSHFKQQGPALEATTAAMYQSDRIEQAKQILQPYILRRLKAQVLSNLPPKHEQVVEVDLLEKQNDNYENILDSVRNVDGDTSNAYGVLMRLRQASNHPLLTRVVYDEQTLDKIAKALCAKEKQYEKKRWEHVSEDLSFSSDFQLHQLCEKYKSTQKFLLDENLVLESGKCKQLDKMLPEIKKKEEKCLIFSQFTSMLDILEVYLRIRGYEFKRLDGQTPVMDRQEMINEFNSTPDLFIFLLSTKAGGLGINLTSANHIILHDIDFNPYNDKQAEDRCHRMGQKKPVYVTRLISKGTVEGGMLVLAQKKLKLEKQVTGGIKGQIEEEDENTRDSNENQEDKLDKNSLQQLLKNAKKRRSLEEMTPSP